MLLGVKESRQEEQRERGEGRAMPPPKGTKKVTEVGGEPRDKKRIELKEGKSLSHAAANFARMIMQGSFCRPCYPSWRAIPVHPKKWLLTLVPSKRTFHNAQNILLNMFV